MRIYIHIYTPIDMLGGGGAVPPGGGGTHRAQDCDLTPLMVRMDAMLVLCDFSRTAARRMW